MQATAAPRSEDDQRPPSLETAPAVRLSDLGWTACLCLLNCTTPRPTPLKGQHRTYRRAGRHRSLSKCATVLPHGGLARSQRRTRQRSKKSPSPVQADSMRRPTYRRERQNRLRPALGERSPAEHAAPRVRFTGRTRETALWRMKVEPPQEALEERLAGSRRISKRETLSEEAQTLQQSQASTTRFSGHHPLLKEKQKN